MMFDNDRNELQRVRGGGGTHKGEEQPHYVTVRSTGIVLSPGLYKALYIDACKYTRVVMSAHPIKLFAHFALLTEDEYQEHRRAGHDTSGIFLLGLDGTGSRKDKNGNIIMRDESKRMRNVIQCSSALRSDGTKRKDARGQSVRFLVQIAQTKAAARRLRAFINKPTSSERSFVCYAQPQFEKNMDSKNAPTAGTGTGVYRYRRKHDGVVVYIGRGILADRARHHKYHKDVDGALYDYVELNDTDKEIEAESYHLWMHHDEYGAPPIFNKVMPKRLGPAPAVRKKAS